MHKVCQVMQGTGRHSNVSRLLRIGMPMKVAGASCADGAVMEGGRGWISWFRSGEGGRLMGIHLHTRLSVPMENEDHIHISIVSWSRVERSVRAM